MKHLTIELSAIDEIISERSLQSIEFSHGASLAKFLKGTSREVALPSSLYMIDEEGDGTFVFTKKKQLHPKHLVIDIKQSKMFDALSESESLFVFQKALRFAKKMWHGLSLTYAERVISGSSKAILFPYQYRPDPYRAVIEKDPLGERLSKRGHRGDFLLLYKGGFEGGDPKEEPEYTVFRKVYESLPSIRDKVRNDVQTTEPQNLDQLRVEQLGDLGDQAAPTMFRGFDEWLPLLTANQTRFVTTPIAGCYRIEGPAGTGKTLSLILKALYSLRQAKSDAKDLHLAFITHSDATKSAVLETVQVMDADGFYKNNSFDAAQSIKVCTLNELCAEQLRQTISEQEFLDRDAMESKGLQRLYISESTDEIVASELSTHEKFMSPELVEFFRNEDAWNVSELVQHEISVVIKGRASESLDAYKATPPLKYGLPIISEADKAFVFTIFRRYWSGPRFTGQSAVGFRH